MDNLESNLNKIILFTLGGSLVIFCITALTILTSWLFSIIISQFGLIDYFRSFPRWVGLVSMSLLMFISVSTIVYQIDRFLIHLFRFLVKRINLYYLAFMSITIFVGACLSLYFIVPDFIVYIHTNYWR